MSFTIPPAHKRFNEALWLSARFWRGFGTLGPRGPKHGDPVVVLPGFLTSDRSSMELRRALAEAGFRVHGWGLGVNNGASPLTINKIIRKINEIYDGRPILLVGWSLGGLFAREVARKIPNKIRAVITLGSPIYGDLHLNNVWKFYEVVAGHRVEASPVPRISEKPPVPTLAIWSREDGLIPPEAARGTEVERDAELELKCSHMAFGISHNTTRQVAAAIKGFLT